MQFSREDGTSYSFSVRALNNVESGYALVSYWRITIVTDVMCLCIIIIIIIGGSDNH